MMEDPIPGWVQPSGKVGFAGVFKAIKVGPCSQIMGIRVLLMVEIEGTFKDLEVHKLGLRLVSFEEGDCLICLVLIMWVVAWSLV